MGTAATAVVTKAVDAALVVLSDDDLVPTSGTEPNVARPPELIVNLVVLLVLNVNEELPVGPIAIPPVLALISSVYTILALAIHILSVKLALPLDPSIVILAVSFVPKTKSLEELLW